MTGLARRVVSLEDESSVFKCTDDCATGVERHKYEVAVVACDEEDWTVACQLAQQPILLLTFLRGPMGW